MTLIMNLQNLQQENGMILMTKIMDNMAQEITMINLKQKSLKRNLCDYSDAYTIVTGDIKVAAAATDTNVAFINCAPFTRFVTHINDEHVETCAKSGYNYALVQFN